MGIFKRKFPDLIEIPMREVGSGVQCGTAILKRVTDDKLKTQRYAIRSFNFYAKWQTYNTIYERVQHSFQGIPEMVLVELSNTDEAKEHFAKTVTCSSCRKPITANQHILVGVDRNHQSHITCPPFSVALRTEPAPTEDRPTLNQELEELAHQYILTVISKGDDERTFPRVLLQVARDLRSGLVSGIGGKR